jgi:hypothetical protein
MPEDDLKELDAIVERAERVLAQKAWDDTVNTVLRAQVVPLDIAMKDGAQHAANFAVSVADHVAEARSRRQQAGKVPLP